MTAIPRASFPPHAPTALTLPDAITRPLREVARRQWRVAAAAAGLRGLLLCLSLLLLTSLLFGFWTSMPVSLRVAVASAAWAAALLGCARVAAPVLRRPRLRDAALAIERSTPGLDERISSAIELANEGDSRFAGSPALVGHLMTQAQADVARVDSLDVVPDAPVRRWAAAVAPAI